MSLQPNAMPQYMDRAGGRVMYNSNQLNIGFKSSECMGLKKRRG